MNMLQPLPPFIASNMTDEEFLGLLDRCEVPSYVRERFVAIIQERDEKRGGAEEAEARVESALALAQRNYESYTDKISTIRERWDELMGRLDSAEEETPADIANVEAALAEAEAFEP